MRVNIVRLIRVVYNSLSEEIVIDEIFCWTDSIITLSWIKGVKQEFKLFVQNRVIKIRNNVNQALCNFCNTRENPADIITRFNSHDLLKNSMWWEGPSFINNLKESKLRDQNLCENILFDENSNKQFAEEFNKEVIVKTQNLSVLSEEKFSIENVINIEQFSDINKLYRVTAWVLRFIGNLKQKCKKKS